MKKTSKIKGLVVLFLNMLNCSLVSFAADPSTSDYGKRLYNVDLTAGFGRAAALIAGYILWVGIALAIGVLIVKGIRFITSSVNGKADVKKELIPWAIGVVLLFTFQIILQFAINFSQQNINTI